MNWQSSYQKSFQWHRWFAWYPIIYCGRTYWLEFVWRKRNCEFYECFWKYNVSKEKPL